MITLKRRPYVLVLDDEPSVSNVIARWLQGWGYSVVTANTADQALELMMRRPPAMVVADLLMPGDHDGLWLIERIHVRWPTTPVIVESGAYDDRTSGGRTLGVNA
jgi:DNA-binding NtrC family response regulator